MLLQESIVFNASGLTVNKHIRSLLPAYDSTFVTSHIEFSPEQGSRPTTLLLHLTKQSKLINKFTYPEMIDDIKMVREDLLMVPLAARDKIELINLRTL